MNMSNENKNVPSFDLDYFEKNRYFQGKLMTARDMLSDQRYHASRLETIAKLGMGSGIVAGLGISEYEVDEEQLEVTIEPGVAIDSKGRPIVVKNPTTRTVDIPDGDELYLYIEHKTEAKDPVPVPGEEPLGEEQSQASRILEVFSLEARETRSNAQKSVLQLIDVPDLRETDKSVAELAHEIATSYHERQRSEVDSHPDSAVFLGSFRQSFEGTWQLGEETDRRPLVYDNDMLFNLIVSHIFDHDNPHNTEMGESEWYMETELDKLDEMSLGLDEMKAEMEEVNDKLEMYTDYTAHKSLKSTARFFDEVADRFEDHSELSRISLAIVEAIRERYTGGDHTEEEAYIEFVGDLHEAFQKLDEELYGAVTKRSHDQFHTAIEGLSDALGEDATTIEVATALDTVGEAAEQLEKQTKVVSDSE